MTPSRTLTAALTAALALALAAGSAAAGFRQIEGTAGYGEQTALPAEAILEVQLLALGQGEAGPEPISSIRVRVLGAKPFPFRLTYDEAMVEEGRDYALAARIALEGETEFESAEATPVLTGVPDEAPHIHMVRPDPEYPAQPSLANTGWRLAEMPAGELTGVAVAEIEFGEKGAARGSGGCNGFSTSYRIEPPQGLSFGKLESTLRGCSAGIAQQERLMFRALGEAQSYRIDEAGALALYDADGALLLRFERRR